MLLVSLSVFIFQKVIVLVKFEGHDMKHTYATLASFRSQSVSIIRINLISW